MKPLTKIQLEVLISKHFSEFRKGHLMSADLSEFFYNVDEYLNRFKAKADRKDVLEMLAAVVEKHGVPYRMYPEPPKDWRHAHRDNLFPERRSMNLKSHQDYRDMDGRWVISGHILENDKPMQINWAAEEAREIAERDALRAEYGEAFRFSLTMGKSDDHCG